jgi:hypothetical protein
LILTGALFDQQGFIFMGKDRAEAATYPRRPKTFNFSFVKLKLTHTFALQIQKQG